MRQQGRALGLLLFYLGALVPGLLLIFIGLRAHSATEPLVAGTVAPTSSVASEIWQARAEMAPATPAAAPARQKIVKASADLSCTDLRALFGLGEPLTEAQKRTLQEHC